MVAGSSITARARRALGFAILLQLHANSGETYLGSQARRYEAPLGIPTVLDRVIQRAIAEADERANGFDSAD